MVERVMIDDQGRVRWLINALCSGPKLQILKMLLADGPLTASEISRRLGIKLSTTLNHLEGLLAAGLLKVEVGGRNRVIKKYAVTAPRIEAVIDLRALLLPPPCMTTATSTTHQAIEVDQELEALALEYINAKRRSKRAKLQIRPKVRDIASTLGVDVDTAIEVARYINTNQRRLAKVLHEDVLQTLRERGGKASIRELADVLRVHPYWIVLCVSELSSEGKADIREGVVHLLEGGT